MSIIRKAFAVLVIIALCMGGVVLAEEATEITAHDFLGEWVNQDGTANINITAHDDEGNYVVNVQLDGVDGEDYDYLVWAYGCVWDEDAQAMVSVSRFAGTGDYATGEEEITDSNLEYADARFSFDDAGMLVWDDANETTDDGMQFEHTIGWVDPDYVGPGHHFVGEWLGERMSIIVEETMENYQVTVSGSGGAFSGAYWAYTCDYDAETDTLVSNGEVASMIEYTFSEDGEDYSEDLIYDDGEAVFSLDDAGNLIWDDKKENAGEGRVFERAAAEEGVGADEDEPIGHIITPNNPEIDIEALADGIYPAAFEPAALADGALTFTVYWEDTFDVVEISQLASGDSLFVGETLVEVETVEKDEDGDLLINGGLDEGGVTLRAYDEDNVWRAVLENDEHTYFNWGETALPLSEDVTFTDGWNIEQEPVTVTGAEAVAEAIAATEMDTFIPENTTVRVEGGQIVEIIRVYIP